MAVWNLFLPEEKGSAKTVTIKFTGKSPPRKALIYRLDSANGSLLPTYEAIGRPIYPTQKQIAELRRAAELPKPETKTLQGGELKLTLPPQGLALIELR
jgi:xylan 1,4-beta-xylosidase